jgi:hypothetical protein
MEYVPGPQGRMDAVQVLWFSHIKAKQLVDAHEPVEDRVPVGSEAVRRLDAVPATGNVRLEGPHQVASHRAFIRRQLPNHRLMRPR